MKELTYTRMGDYYIPDIALSEQTNESIGKYGMKFSVCSQTRR